MKSVAIRVRELATVAAQHRDREELVPALACARKAMAYAQSLDDDPETLGIAELAYGAALLAPADQSRGGIEEGIGLVQRAAQRFESVDSIEHFAALLELGDARRRLGDHDEAVACYGAIRGDLGSEPWQHRDRPRADHLRAVAIIRLGQIAVAQDSLSIAMDQFVAAGELLLAGGSEERPWVDFVADYVKENIGGAEDFVAWLRAEANQRWGSDEASST
jgi:hypothetical protein